MVYINMSVLGDFGGTEKEFQMVCKRKGDYGKVRAWGQKLQ